MTQKFCPKCQDWYPFEIYGDHMKQHNVGMNSDALNAPQYTGGTSKKGDDYAICVLHQKKCPCPINGCKYTPFGWIRKSLMMQYFKAGVWKWHDRYGNPDYVKINTEKRSVVLFGVEIIIRI